MKFPLLQRLTLLALTLAVVPATLLASDFTYQETTQITGGSIVSMLKMAGSFSSQARKAGEPIVTSIYIKDNRMAKITPDGIEIIDIDRETITHVDTVKHTYTVMTFQQMRDQVAKAEQDMQKNEVAHPAEKPAPNPNADNVKVSFDVKVRNTGATKDVSGLPAKEAILTMMMNATDQNTQQTGAMAITNDMWMVPEIPGYRQVGEFYMRMAEKMGTMGPGINAGAGVDMTKMLAQHPGATLALADMAKEMQKLKGVPVMQIMRMGVTTDGKPLPAASEAPLPPSNSPAMPSGGDVAKQSAASILTSHIPFGFGRKKADPPPDQNQNANSDSKTPPPTSSVLMESQTSTSAFSSAPVDPSHFDVPAGYKQVQPPTAR
jgi:hypothetical protein